MSKRTEQQVNEISELQITKIRMNTLFLSVVLSCLISTQSQTEWIYKKNSTAHTHRERARKMVWEKKTLNIEYV